MSTYITSVHTYFQILVAATRLSPNTAITEFQGKYLLASQWNAQQPVSSQPYMPYVLQYHMPKEGLTVCVDARTYGNDARFTRHSCTPNAEVSLWDSKCFIVFVNFVQLITLRLNFIVEGNIHRGLNRTP